MTSVCICVKWHHPRLQSSTSDGFNGLDVPFLVVVSWNEGIPSSVGTYTYMDSNSTRPCSRPQGLGPRKESLQSQTSKKKATFLRLLKMYVDYPSPFQEGNME